MIIDNRFYRFKSIFGYRLRALMEMVFSLFMGATISSFKVLLVTIDTPGYMASLKSAVTHSIAAAPKPVSTSSAAVKLYYQTPASKDDFICLLCHKSYKSLGTMGNHLRVKHGQTLVIKCDKCNTVFVDAKALNRHTKAKTDCTMLPFS